MPAHGIEAIVGVFKNRPFAATSGTPPPVQHQRNRLLLHSPHRKTVGRNAPTVSLAVDPEVRLALEKDG